MNTAKLITVWISSSECYSEKKLGNDLTLHQLADKLEIITGIPLRSQRVLLQKTLNEAGHGGNGEGEGVKEVIMVLSDQPLERTLEQCGVQEWMTIRVNSTDPQAASAMGQYTDTSRVEKFDITAQEYEARPDTVRSYKQLHKLGRFAPPSPATYPAPPTLLGPEYKLGARCQVSLSDELYRRGAVRFIGPTKFGNEPQDLWIGVEFDEPVGKGDGAVAGQRYFTTLPLRASFFKPDKVEMGDFPEIDPFADDDDEDDDMEEM